MTHDHAHLRTPVLLSILAALTTLALKFTAYFLTGSVGLLSDALESIINLAAALIAFASLWYAAQPADRTHTYGHAKIEFFSSGLEGTLILVAAGGIAWYAVERLIRPQPLQSLDVGLVLGLVASAINFGVAVVLVRVGRAQRSIVLEADGQHLMTDVWTSVAVIAGLGVVWLTGLAWLDPVIALMVAANVVLTGFKLVRRSFNGLMDHALPEADQREIRAALDAHLRPGTAYHALRTRAVGGAHRLADFHLLVPGAMPVQEAHAYGEELERAVRAALPDLEVVIHIEPIEERASWMDHNLTFEPPAAVKEE
jgi:cation diffusion facilitator family transporter